jgi:hypothetical protein
MLACSITVSPLVAEEPMGRFPSIILLMIILIVVFNVDGSLSSGLATVRH